MNDKIYESLSALIDGEQRDSAELLEHIAADPELKARWEEHYRTRAAIHGDYCGALGNGFAKRVSAAVAQEPAILAPRARAVSGEVRSTRWQRPLAGLAIAATVAAISIVGLQNFSTDNVSSNSQVASQAHPARLHTLSPSTSGSAVRRASLGRAGIHWQVQRVEQERDPALEKRLNMYLADHMEHANSAKIQSVLPYSRLVGYDTSE